MTEEIDLNKSDLIQDDINTEKIEPITEQPTETENIQVIDEEKVQKIKNEMIASSIEIEKLKIEIEKTSQIPMIQEQSAGILMEKVKKLNELISENKEIYEKEKDNIEDAVKKYNYPLTVEQINLKAYQEKLARRQLAKENYIKSVNESENKYRELRAKGKIPPNPEFEKKIEEAKKNIKELEPKKSKKNKKDYN